MGRAVNSTHFSRAGRVTLFVCGCATVRVHDDDDGGAFNESTRKMNNALVLIGPFLLW